MTSTPLADTDPLQRSSTTSAIAPFAQVDSLDSLDVTTPPLAPHTAPYQAFVQFRLAADIPASVGSITQLQLVHLCARYAEQLALLKPDMADAHDTLTHAALLLDLGRCVDQEGNNEARSLVHHLLAQLSLAGYRACAGLGPTGILAQLALFSRYSHHLAASPIATPSRARRASAAPPVISHLSAAQAPTFLQRLPVTLFPSVYPRGILTPDLVQRLHHFGLHTFGQIARLDESMLRRQFGDFVGAFLAAVAIGADPQPFTPTRLPPHRAFRLRFVSPATPERLLAALPAFCTAIAHWLDEEHMTTQRLSLCLCWATGTSQQTSWTLRQPTAQPHLLLGELYRHLLPWIQHTRHTRHTQHTQNMPGEQGRDERNTDEREQIEDLRLTLEDLHPDLPQQTALALLEHRWRLLQSPQATQRQTIRTLAETLTSRYTSASLLMHPQVTHPDAVFAEERYAFEQISSSSDISDTSRRTARAAGTTARRASST